MVKILKILSISFICLFSFHFTNAQILDSIKCDEYFRSLEKTKLVDLWSQAPILKENNLPVLCELCHIVLNDSCKNFITTLILGIKGNPLCIQIYPEIRNDSINDKVMKLLYLLEFKPAIGYKDPVISHYGLIINSKKCEMYINKQKKWKKRHS